MTPRSAGKLIVAVGLPCSGKSSVMGALGSMINAQVFLEPEEKEWGKAVLQWEQCCHFTGLMWFRSARVPLLREADRVRASGGIALVDSYYDKLIAHYLARPGMEWLLSPNDPYFELAMGVARTDWRILPDADCIVTFEVEPADWRAMLARRNRALDRDEAFSKSYETQRYFIEAAMQLAAERNIRIVHFRQTFGTVEDAAERLLAALREAGILS
jgi:thymidylate kinase